MRIFHNMKAHTFIDCEFAVASAGHFPIPMDEAELRGWPVQHLHLPGNLGGGKAQWHGTHVGSKIGNLCLNMTAVKIVRVLGVWNEVGHLYGRPQPNSYR